MAGTAENQEPNGMQEMDQQHFHSNGNAVVMLSAARNGRLTLCQKLCYSVGHVFNDLCAAVWFTYMLLYLQCTVKLSSSLAGVIILVGQVVDAVSTPLIGYESDSCEASCGRFSGKRKSWHLFGTLSVGLAFPMMFLGCPGCESAHEYAYLILLVTLVVIFQIGWASTQISHLALIPELTENERDRDVINNMRYFFGEAADTFVYLVMFLVISMHAEGTKETSGIGQEDAPKFKIMVMVLTAVGLIFSAIFHIGVKEKSNNRVQNCQNTNEKATKLKHEAGSTEATPQRPKTVLNHHKLRRWLMEPQFYQVGLVYVFSRLFVTLTIIYFPLYLEESGSQERMIVYIPLILTTTGMLTSLVLDRINAVIGKKMSFIVACATSLTGCVILFFDYNPKFLGRGEFAVALLMGVGGSAMLAVSLSLVPDLLGNNVENTAFIYGCYSFFEKLCSGVAVMIIQQINQYTCDDCDWFYRAVMLYVLGIFVIAAFISLLSIMSVTLGVDKKFQAAEDRRRAIEVENSETENETQPLLSRVRQQRHERLQNHEHRNVMICDVITAWHRL